MISARKTKKGSRLVDTRERLSDLCLGVCVCVCVRWGGQRAAERTVALAGTSAGQSHARDRSKMAAPDLMTRARVRRWRNWRRTWRSKWPHCAPDRYVQAADLAPSPSVIRAASAPEKNQKKTKENCVRGHHERVNKNTREAVPPAGGDGLGEASGASGAGEQESEATAGFRRDFGGHLRLLSGQSPTSTGTHGGRRGGRRFSPSTDASPLPMLRAKKKKVCPKIGLAPPSPLSVTVV